MKKIIHILILLLGITSVSISQDTLRRENGVIYLGLPLVSTPNTIDGWGSADNGAFGEDYIYTYIEQNDSYNGNNLEGSRWKSYGEFLPEKFPDAIAIGLGFMPDTFIWDFHVDTLFVEVKDTETPLSQNYTFLYDVFDGANPGPLDSLHISEIDGTLEEPSIIQVFPQQGTTPVPYVANEIFEIKLLQNQGGNNAFLKMDLPEKTKMNYSIFSSNGQLVSYRNNIHVWPGENKIEIPRPLSNGIYFIKVQLENHQIHTLKWVVVEK